eukprot:3108036-Rhodomonas_salina.1
MDDPRRAGGPSSLRPDAFNASAAHAFADPFAGAACRPDVFAAGPSSAFVSGADVFAGPSNAFGGAPHHAFAASNAGGPPSSSSLLPMHPPRQQLPPQQQGAPLSPQVPPNGAFGQLQFAFPGTLPTLHAEGQPDSSHQQVASPTTPYPPLETVSEIQAKHARFRCTLPQRVAVCASGGAPSRARWHRGVTCAAVTRARLAARGAELARLCASVCIRVHLCASAVCASVCIRVHPPCPFAVCIRVHPHHDARR